TIAEESTAWPKVTGAPEDGGLGFTFKWNMGWMHDFLNYMKQDPLFRKFHHNDMTFAMSYSEAENFILPISHDEVVHLKCSMFEKMPGYEIDKYKNLKCAYAFMIGHPGKKLLFMGQEFGQRREWSEGRELDWFMLGDERNQDLKKFVRDLLHLYRRSHALWQEDRGFAGFEWLGVDASSRSIFSFARYSHDRRHPLIFTVNFTPMERGDYRLGVPTKGHYELVLDETRGLIPQKDRPVFAAEDISADNRYQSIAYPLPAYGIAVFRRK
ncbi:MAG: alpha amylase C-terminal domain-containing protein, partial [Lachnospiraceae bacterium]|nr:alpha amylase C-terminal domain-containing protein [Lachnospiraceae bacterium]